MSKVVVLDTALLVVILRNGSLESDTLFDKEGDSDLMIDWVVVDSSSVGGGTVDSSVEAKVDGSCEGGMVVGGKEGDCSREDGDEDTVTVRDCSCKGDSKAKGDGWLYAEGCV